MEYTSTTAPMSRVISVKTLEIGSAAKERSIPQAGIHGTDQVFGAGPEAEPVPEGLTARSAGR